MGSHSSYLYGIFKNKNILKSNVMRVKKNIQEFLDKNPIDNLVVTGTGISGTVTATLLAYECDLELCIVRKNLENSHADSIIESTIINITNYIIVDDFVETGDTVRKIHKTITKHHPNSKLLGFFGFDISESSKKYREESSLRQVKDVCPVVIY